MLTSRFGKVALVVAAALVLSGCERFPSSDLAIQVRDGTLILGTCESLSGDGALMEERGDRGDDWSIFYKYFKAIELRPGDEIVIGATPDAILDTSVDRLPRLDPGDEISVLLGGGGGEQLRGSFEIPKTGVPDDAWLHPDGSESDELCLVEVDR